MAASFAAQLIPVVTLLGAAVVSVPLFRRLGLGSVLGYLAAGVAIGPFGLGRFNRPDALLHVAELGVVMFLFVIGLEMQPRHLWAMRRQIFGLGSLQMVVCGLLLTTIAIWVFDVRPPVAFVCAMGFVLTSTAIVMQLLGERGDIATPAGQRIVAILLMEDLLIVPLLAVVAFLGTGASGGAPLPPAEPLWQRVALAGAAIAGVVAAGLWLLNPMFRVLARAKAREAMTAAALLVVLGAALLMEMGGLSMAMGAFIAGVLLSESSFRHQLEADIEPFRGLLLGLFFIAVGMSLNLGVVAANLGLVLAGVATTMAAKALCIYAVARLARASHDESVDRATLMAQGGEFAFVLYNAAQAAGVIDGSVNATATAVVVLSMALTPLVVMLHKRFVRKPAVSLDGVDTPEDLHGSVVIIGFGRVGQIVVQSALLRGAEIVVIDNDAETVRFAGRIGFKVYYGDGARIDVLHAAGAHEARAIVVCIDDKDAVTRIAETAKTAFPQAALLVRAYDRAHAWDLARTDADHVVRETFDAALALGRLTAIALGATEDEADDHVAELRRRDAERFALETAGGRFAGRALILRNMPDDMLARDKTREGVSAPRDRRPPPASGRA